MLPFLLLDFDGPVCSVFAGRPAADVAASLKALAGIETETDDPLRILVEVASQSDPILTSRVADALRDAEVAAVASATPTDGADLAIRDAGTVVIVSNNSGAAVEAYLRAHDLLPFVAGISARDDDLDPGLMKPHPYLVERGLRIAGVQPDEAVMVGDSVTDVEAARAAGVRVIGFANKPAKLDSLRGADAVIISMRALAEDTP